MSGDWLGDFSGEQGDHFSMTRLIKIEQGLRFIAAKIGVAGFFLGNEAFGFCDGLTSAVRVVGVHAVLPVAVALSMNKL